MRIADFGLNANQDIESIYSRLKNTTYLAPEVLEGKKYTDKSDIWSLGFIFYEVLFAIKSYCMDVCHGRQVDLLRFTSKESRMNHWSFPTSQKSLKN